MNASDTAWLTGLRNSYRANGVTEAVLKAIGDGMSASGPALSHFSTANGAAEIPEQSRMVGDEEPLWIDHASIH